MCAAAGAGPAPIPQKNFTAETLSQAIKYCLSSEAADAAQGISEKMQAEVGVRSAVRSFHQNLPTERISCGLLPHLPAAFRYKKGKKEVLLSTFAAEVISHDLPKEAKNIELYVLSSRFQS